MVRLTILLGVSSRPSSRQQGCLRGPVSGAAILEFYYEMQKSKYRHKRIEKDPIDSEDTQRMKRFSFILLYSLYHRFR